MVQSPASNLDTDLTLDVFLRLPETQLAAAD